MIEETRDPQNNYRQATTESMIINNGEAYEITPGENQLTISIIFDYHCEEMAFPKLFSTGKFGFKVKQEI